MIYLPTHVATLGFCTQLVSSTAPWALPNFVLPAPTKAFHAE
jgi:hypothetical protein